jgi:8-oxo-dGTP pyrophosphatase MutT (NUDIX family)
MIILERYLDADGLRLRIGGVVTRDIAHYQGVPHGAVQVAIVVLKEAKPHILLHKRSHLKKTSPNTWDICGGHIDANEKILVTAQL